MTVRNNLSWSEATEQKAQDIIAARKLDGMTDLVKTLVREEWDRRHLSPVPEQVTSSPSPTTAATARAKKIQDKLHHKKAVSE